MSETAALRITVDRGSPVPLYFQVAQGIQAAIESGELPPGSRLDNEIGLAERLGLSRPTVRQAIMYLVDRGLLVRRRGVGTQVVAPILRRPVELTSLYDDLAGGGRRPRSQVRSFRVEPAAAVVAEALGVPEGSEVYAIERLRYADERPLALMRNHVPVDLLALTEDELSTRGLYEIMRGKGVVMRIANQVIGAKSASAAEARLLDESRGAPLLTMTRTTFDDKGRAVEHGDHLYRASQYAFELRLASG